MSVYWKWATVVGVAVAILFALKVYAKAVGEANIYRDQVTALHDTLDIVEADTVRLSTLLRLTDEANAVKAARDSVRIFALKDINASLSANIEILRASETEYAKGLEGALSVLAERLGPEDLPYLRHVVEAQEAVFSTLRGQLTVKDTELANRVEEIGIIRLALNGALEGRRAADAFAGGLRTQIVTQAEIIETQALEIGSLRSAIVPGIIAKITQNSQLVGITATVTTVLVLLVR